MELVRKYEVSSDGLPVTESLELLHHIDLEAALLSNGSKDVCISDVLIFASDMSKLLFEPVPDCWEAEDAYSGGSFKLAYNRQVVCLSCRLQPRLQRCRGHSAFAKAKGSLFIPFSCCSIFFNLRHVCHTSAVTCSNTEDMKMIKVQHASKCTAFFICWKSSATSGCRPCPDIIEHQQVWVSPFDPQLSAGSTWDSICSGFHGFIIHLEISHEWVALRPLQNVFFVNSNG